MRPRRETRIRGCEPTARIVLLVLDVGHLEAEVRVSGCDVLLAPGYAFGEHIDSLVRSRPSRYRKTVSVVKCGSRSPRVEPSETRIIVGPAPPFRPGRR